MRKFAIIAWCVRVKIIFSGDFKNYLTKATKKYDVGLRKIKLPYFQVTEWVVQLIISKGSHQGRRALLCCILRLMQASWNIGNFNGVMEILLGLRYVAKEFFFSRAINAFTKIKSLNKDPGQKYHWRKRCHCRRRRRREEKGVWFSGAQEFRSGLNGWF